MGYDVAVKPGASDATGPVKAGAVVRWESQRSRGRSIPTICRSKAKATLRTPSHPLPATRPTAAMQA